MPAQIGSLFVSLTLNAQPYAQGMTRAQAVTAGAMGRIRRDAGVAEKSVQSFWNTTGRGFRPYSLIAVSRAFDNTADRAGLLRGSLLATTAVFGGFTAALSSNLVLRYADSYTKLINQLRVVSSGAADTAARFEAIEEVARRSRSALEATAILYSRIQKASPDRSADEILRYTETIQKALTLGGATAQEARSAAIQFSQAIASNRLGGEELRAILETPLGLELARGLGVTLGKFREMGHAGQLTADVVLGALAKISDRIDGQFSQSIQTLDQALIHVDNRFTSYFGSLNTAIGGTALLSKAIVGLGDNLETIVPTLTTILGLLAAVSVARNKALFGGLLGGAGGALVGHELGGLSGAVVGGLIGGLGGLRAARTSLDDEGNWRGLFATIREGNKQAAEATATLTDRVALLRKEYYAAAIAANQARLAAKIDPILAAKPGLQNQFRSVLLDPNASYASIVKARDAAIVDGQAKLKAQVTQTAAAYRALGGELRTAQVDFVNVAKATTIAGQAKAFLGRQATALVGLFGGPWGIAITAAVVGLSLLGLRAQQNAQKVANAQRIIAEALREAADAGDQKAGKTVIELQKEKLEEDLKALDEFARTKLSEVFSKIDYFIGVGSNIPLFERRSAYDKVKQDVADLFYALRDGKVTLEQFNSEIAAIGRTDPLFAALAQRALAAGKEIDREALAVKVLSDNVSGLAQKLNRENPFRLRFQIAFEGFANDLNGALSRRAEEGSMAALNAISPATLLGDLDFEVRQSERKAKGLTAEAKAWEYVRKAAADGQYVSYQAALAKFTQIEANEKAAAALKKEGTAAENLTDRLARLKAESAGAFLPELDREVVRQARELKVATTDIEAYIKAVQAGNLTSAPPRLVELRDQKLYEQAADSARDIVREYGNWEQIAPLAAAKQQELNIAVANGAITAEQARRAYADFLLGFESFEGINDLSTAIAEFAGNAITNFNNIKDVAKDFAKTLADIAKQALIVEPLKKFLNVGISGLFSGLLGAPTVSGVGATLFHGGGDVRPGGSMRMMPAGAFAGAPRFHSGLKHGEIASVLKQGEVVLTEQMARRNAAVTGSLAKMAGQGGRGDVKLGDMQINVHGTGDKELIAQMRAGARAAAGEAIRDYDRSFIPRVKHVMSDPRAE